MPKDTAAKEATGLLPPRGTVTESPSAPVGSPADPETALIHAAIDKGVSVETMEKLVLLKERMEDRRAAQEFAAALARFQGQALSVQKNKETDYTTKAGGRVHYTYATLDQIAAAVRPGLLAAGLSYSWDATVADRKVKVVCTLRHENGHRETSTFEAPVDSESKMNATQQVGAALTYGKRYSLISILGLTTAEEDTDGLGGKPRGGTNGGGSALNADRVADLEALIDEVKADRAKFLVYMGVASVEDIAPEDYGKAVKALEAKRRGGA